MHKNSIVPDGAGVVSIAEVRISPDLLIATVFISLLSGENADKNKELEVYLNGQSPLIRKLLAKKMILRSVPNLKFVVDDIIEHGAKLETKIAECLYDDK